MTSEVSASQERISDFEGFEIEEGNNPIRFFDPSQERDESGRWTSVGGSSEIQNPSQGEAINADSPQQRIDSQLNENEKEISKALMGGTGANYSSKYIDQNSERAVELQNQYEKDIVSWSKSMNQNGVTQDEAGDIAKSMYAYAQSDFSDINDFLRGIDGDEDSGPNLGIMAKIESLQRALEVSPKIEENNIFRGSSAYPNNENTVHNLAKLVKVGAIIRDLGFTSFSKREEIANRFSKKEVRNLGRISAISLKVTNARGKATAMPIWASSFPNEKEVLLPPETAIRVTRVQRERYLADKEYKAKGDDPFTYFTQIEGEIVNE